MFPWLWDSLGRKYGKSLQSGPNRPKSLKNFKNFQKGGGTPHGWVGGCLVGLVGLVGSLDLIKALGLINVIGLICILLSHFSYTSQGPLHAAPTGAPSGSPSARPSAGPSTSPTASPTTTPSTGTPTWSPSAAPTEHPCTDGSHGCVKTAQGICFAGAGNSWHCGCVPGFVCVPDCNATDHTCEEVTASPTTSPSASPSSAPTAALSSSQTVASSSVPTAAPTTTLSSSPSTQPGLENFHGEKVFSEINRKSPRKVFS